MQPESLLRLFQFIINYPLYIVAIIGFAVMHHRFANRLGCYGVFRNLLYIAACMVIATGLFFTGVLLVRYTGINPRMSSLLSSQLIVGFVFAAILVAGRRILFRTKPQTTKILS